MELFFLQRETHSKENAFFSFMNSKFATNFEAKKFRVTLFRSIS